MLRYVVDEILSKSFDYFLKDKSSISSRSNNETSTIGQVQSNTNSNRNEKKSTRKANTPPPLRGLFSRSSRSRKASPKLLPVKVNQMRTHFTTSSIGLENLEKVWI
jgi:hypothetical protein